MVLKTFEIDWKDGEKATIEYEDDLTFGELENIINQSIDLTDVSKPKVNIPAYRRNILTKVITKAPFRTGDINIINGLKSKVTKKIISEVMKDYPLMQFLEDWMVTFVGTPQVTNTPTESTTTLPKPSDGISTK